MNQSKSPIRPMSESQLSGIIQQQTQRSLMHYTSEIANNIKDATRYYYGEKFGNEIKGKSQVVSRDVGDAVDWIMPSLMRIFGGSDRVCEFEPHSEQDEAEAEQATDYINYIYNRRNPGFTISYQFIKDILLNKNGILKVEYSVKKIPTTSYYSGLSKEVVDFLLADDNTEIVSISQTGEDQFDIKINEYKDKKEYNVIVIPPEEFLIHPLAKSADDSEFTAWRRRVSKSDLREIGVPESVIGRIQWNTGDNAYSSQGILAARHAPDGSAASDFSLGTPTTPAMEKTWYQESYIYIDFDGDGIAELRRVCSAGNTIISNDEWDESPFIGATANIISHKFYGLSLYDKLHDIQEIKSTLMRNMLDNIYSINHGRWQVIDGQVNLDDLLQNTSNGVVRVKMRDAVTPLPTPELPAENFQMLNYLDSVREDRAGVSKTSSGLDSNILHSNQSASAVNQVMTAAQQQIELIARVIAETGFKPLFSKLYALTTRHQDADDIFRLRGKFISVSPSSWNKQRTVNVVVGLGNHNKDQQLIHLQNMWNMAQGIVGNGGLNILTTYDRLYNLLSKISENSGYPDFHKYWLDPNSPQGRQGIKDFQEAQAKPKPEDIKANAQAQQVQVDAAKVKGDLSNRARELDIRERECAIKEKELTLEADKISLMRDELQIKRYEAVADATLTLDSNKAVAIGDGKIPV